MDDDYWGAVRTLRLGLADMLDTLSPGEWDAASLCGGWRVRDVAGHLALVPSITTWQMVAAAPRARFNPNRINTLLAVRAGSVATSEIVQQLRAHAGDRTTAKALDTRNSLFDAIVHSQDIAIPLGRSFPIPVDFTRQGLGRVWSMGWPFNASRRLAGRTLTATDADWSVGSGPEISGSALSLLLLLTGRTATARRELAGAGLDGLHA
ncbi:TIGR03083 family protein [Friedmanniella luteola]|uniref:TIGR03083 family protein n=1 Tax=Friedmanniella luteola TaxID=546871 RepID=A0A1H1T4E2_9ACTN|nr:maleylpyruvate isomerase family mycothiol-dependent enzyme [Friedmanniella luteola]SDS54559.1 TIGR03083 family protein [Friedmanniella luteola]